MFGLTIISKKQLRRFKKLEEALESIEKKIDYDKTKYSQEISKLEDKIASLYQQTEEDMYSGRLVITTRNTMGIASNPKPIYQKEPRGFYRFIRVYDILNPQTFHVSQLSVNQNEIRLPTTAEVKDARKNGLKIKICENDED